MFKTASNSYSLALLTGCVLGYLFSFEAWTLAKFSNHILFFMMFISGLTLGRSFNSTLGVSFKKEAKELFLAIILAQIVLPILFFHVSKIVIKDFDISLGILICNIMPVAVVMPHIILSYHNTSAFVFFILYGSTLVAPFILLICLTLISSNSVLTGLSSLFTIFFVISLLAPLLGFWVGRNYRFKRFLPISTTKINITQSILLTVLVFILFGSVFRNFSFRQMDASHWIYLGAFGILQDFGTYLFFLIVGKFFFEKEKVSVLAYSFGMKNVALASGPLLVWNPRSATPMAFVFLIHVTFLIWLNFRLKKDIVKKNSSY